MTPVLEARNIHYTISGYELLAGVDLTVHTGERLAITGPSGTGKSTLLAILAGMLTPTSGAILLHGQPLNGLATPQMGVATILQGYGLVSLLTAAENVEIGLQACGKTRRQAHDQARKALRQVGLAAHADQLVDELSGGQQQRTAIARALAVEPRLLIADEPTAELDPATRALIMTTIHHAANHGGAIVIATHDLELADQCDRRLDLTATSRTPASQHSRIGSAEQMR